MGYYLLTGATGLLGRYLLRDLARAEVPLAVVVRPTRWESAQQRVETALAQWETELGRALARPVVLEGDICSTNLGLKESDAKWVKRHVRSVVHSAASLTFYEEADTGEPWRSNVQGTQHVIDLCRACEIRDYHHVSTAYVCGQRRGKICESELNVGQQLGNDYERSKLTSEQNAISAGCFEHVTVYRPSIIVGDSQTGFTTSYHGFYTPLRLLHALVQSLSWETVNQGNWVGPLQLKGTERKNLVPVDWVSAAMTKLLLSPAAAGQTYHLTNPQPATVQQMMIAFAQALSAYDARRTVRRSAAPPSEELIQSFREQMKVYQSYWSDDPEFDSTNTTQMLPDLPCPAVNEELMGRLIQFAIDGNFGWPRETPRVPALQVAHHLARWLDVAEPPASQNSGAIGLQVTGGGGGQWELVLENGRLIAVRMGLSDMVRTTCHLTTETWSNVVQGRQSCEAAIRAGKLIVAGRTLHPVELSELFAEFRSAS